MKEIKLFVPVKRGTIIKFVHPEKVEKGWRVIQSFEEKKKYLKYKTMEGINENYIIFEDGSVYSLHFGGRFLKPEKQSPKRLMPHFVYPISRENAIGKKERKRWQISRLWFFYFGKHHYRDIDELPVLIYIDGNTGNIRNNIRIAKKGEIQLKASKKAKRRKSHQKIPSTVTSQKKIIEMTRGGKTLVEIGELFGTSHASVTRFINRVGMRKEVEEARRGALKEKE